MSGSYAVAAANPVTTETEAAVPAPAQVQVPPPGLVPTMAAPPIGIPPAAMVAQYVETALANRMQQIVATVTADVIGAMTGQNMNPAFGPGGGGGGRPRNNQGGRRNNGPDPILAAARERFLNEYCLKTEAQLCEIAGTSTLDDITHKIEVMVVPFDPDQKLKIVEGGREFTLVKFSRDFGKTLSKRVKDYYWDYGFYLYYTYRQGEGFVFELTPNC